METLADLVALPTSHHLALPCAVRGPLGVQSGVEVSQADWKLVGGVDPSAAAAEPDTHPVENIDWYSAIAYANWRSARDGLETCYTLSPSTCANTTSDWVDGTASCTEATPRYADPTRCRGYRLPLETEWEMAARAGAQTMTQLGDLIAPYGCEDQAALSSIAWYCFNATGTRPVGTRNANAIGMFDAIGNVREWVWDFYGNYPVGPTLDYTGPGSGSSRTVRGGAWDLPANQTWLASRVGVAPTSRSGNTGFRLVRSAP